MEAIEKLQPGTIDGLGIITITEKESNIPHFTITKYDGTIVSIMIQDNRYMDKSSKLSPDECRILNDWAHGYRNESTTGDLNWDHVLLCWNELYNDNEIIADISGEYLNNIPNYSTIKLYE